MRKMCQVRIPVDLWDRAKGAAKLRDSTLTDLIVEALGRVVDESLEQVDQLIESRAASLQETANQLRQSAGGKK